MLLDRLEHVNRWSVCRRCVQDAKRVEVYAVIHRTGGWSESSAYETRVVNG